MIKVKKLISFDTCFNNELSDMDRMLSAYASRHTVPIVASREFIDGVIHAVTKDLK